MEILPYEIIKAEFKPWTETYLAVAQALIRLIETDEIQVMHFGSTSAKVGGKGIIDLSVLYPEGQLQAAVDHMNTHGFQDQASAKPFPPERPRKDAAVLFEGRKYLIHAHVIQKHSEEHQRQRAYRDYLLANPEVRADYERQKKAILSEGVTDQEAYVKRKAPFVKTILNGLER